MGKGILKHDSYNCRRERGYGGAGKPTHKICGPLDDEDAWATGVVWHHGAGHSSGRGVYYFWARDDEDYAVLAELQETVKQRIAEKKARRFPSKAAVWRYVWDTRHEHQTDMGCGSMTVKEGKYGLNEYYGKLLFTFYFKDFKERDDIELALYGIPPLHQTS